MTDIYRQHDRAFDRVSAYVVVDPETNTKVGTVSIKYPADGAGRLWAYVHWLGVEMQRGYASGYGYDKGSAAVSAAAHKIAREETPSPRQDAFLRVLQADDGWTWNSRLEAAGFTVLQAV